MDEPLLADGTTVEDATATLLDAGIGDGLPVVPPTLARLEEMLAATPDPDATLGAVPPLFRDLTPARAAYHAVLAGCRPAELPVVLAALRACLEPEFNLLGVQTTTGAAAVAVVVRGPVVAALGMTTGANLLGPGNRANASVGGASRWRWPGSAGRGRGRPTWRRPASPPATACACPCRPGRTTAPA